MMILQKSVLNLFKLIICKNFFVYCYTNYNAKNTYSSGKQLIIIVSTVLCKNEKS